eukprot:14482313-Alexandrium_andersonii.AAC.1
MTETPWTEESPPQTPSGAFSGSPPRIPLSEFPGRQHVAHRGAAQYPSRSGTERGLKGPLRKQ